MGHDIGPGCPPPSHGLPQQRQAGSGAVDRGADPGVCGLARQGSAGFPVLTPSLLRWPEPEQILNQVRLWAVQAAADHPGLEWAPGGAAAQRRCPGAHAHRTRRTAGQQLSHRRSAAKGASIWKPALPRSKHRSPAWRRGSRWLEVWWSGSGPIAEKPVGKSLPHSNRTCTLALF